jgi:hypothetical protein
MAKVKQITLKCAIYLDSAILDSQGGSTTSRMLLSGDDTKIHDPVDVEALGGQVSFLSALSLSELFVE